MHSTACGSIPDASESDLREWVQFFGIVPSDTAETVRTKKRMRARQFHPNKIVNAPGSGERMQQINHWGEVLTTAYEAGVLPCLGNELWGEAWPPPIQVQLPKTKANARRETEMTAADDRNKQQQQRASEESRERNRQRALEESRERNRLEREQQQQQQRERNRQEREREQQRERNRLFENLERERKHSMRNRRRDPGYTPDPRVMQFDADCPVLGQKRYHEANRRAPPRHGNHPGCRGRVFTGYDGHEYISRLDTSGERYNWRKIAIINLT